MPRRIAKKIYFKASRTTGTRKLKPATGKKKPRRMYKDKDYLEFYAPSGNDFLKIGGGVALGGIGIGAARAGGNLFRYEKRSPMKERRLRR